MTETVSLYNDSIKLRYRDVGHAYAVSHDGKTWKEVVGVTTILGKTLHKEGLALWPMYEALDYIKKYGVGVVGRVEFEGLGWIVSEAVIEEAAKAHLQKSQKGMSTGTEVHAAIEKFLREEMAEQQENPSHELLATSYAETGEPDGAAEAIDAFQKWFTQTQPKVLAAEQLVYSREYDYAGRTDAVLEIDGKTYLMDVKTNNRTRTAPLGVYDSHLVQLGGYSLAWREMGNKVDDLLVVAVDKTGNLSALKASDLGLSVEFCEDAFASTVKLYKFLNPLQRQLKERITS